MASYHFEIKSGKKGSAWDHARYIAREGKYGTRHDLLAKGDGNMPQWAVHDHALFWKGADQFERANGAAYREFIFALPNELSLQQNLKTVQTAIGALIGDRPYQFAVHGPEGKLSGIQNLHVHIMFSDRQPDGLQRPLERTFARYNSEHPERGGCRKASGGKTSMQVRDELIAKRRLIADILNQQLADAGVEARVDHRSYKDRGMQRKPERHLGPGRVRAMTADEKAELTAARRDAESSGE